MIKTRWEIVVSLMRGKKCYGKSVLAIVMMASVLAKLSLVEFVLS